MKNLKSDDFLKSPKEIEEANVEDFEFSEYSDSDTDDYEDTIETPDEADANPFETPLKFKSVFGKNEVQRSLSRKRDHSGLGSNDDRPKSRTRMTSTPSGSSKGAVSKLPQLKTK